MGKKNSKIQQEATPTLAQYLAQRAQQVRDSAAFELSHQDSPDIPVLPRVSDNTIAYWDARFGTPDSTLIQKYGVEPNTGNVFSKDIWKYNPWDWNVRWGELQGTSTQAGIMDKLGTPFITTSKNKLNPEAMLYLKSKK